MSSSLTPWQYYTKRKSKIQSELTPHYAKMLAGEPVCRNEVTRLRRELGATCYHIALLASENRKRRKRRPNRVSHPGGYGMTRLEPKLPEPEKHVYPLVLMWGRK